MRSIARLKEIARSHEQKEEWDKAIQAYEQVLQRARAGEADLELPLFNRVGDLHLRLGRAAEAVRYYEEAADQYAEEGLYNNAIALCSKALRHQPDRIELYRKLGRLSMRQGFLTDARRWFLEYAERQLKAGARKDAFAALEEFAELANDAEARELLAGHLEAQGETSEAVTHLRQAYFIRLANGESERADALRERILSLDPSADLTPPEAPAEPEVPEPFDPLSIPPLPGIDLQTAADAAGIEEETETRLDTAPESVPEATPVTVPEDDSIESLLAAVRALPEDDVEDDESEEPEIEPLPLLEPGPEPDDFGTIELSVDPLPELDDELAAMRDLPLEEPPAAPQDLSTDPGADIFDLPDDLPTIGDLSLPTLDDPVVVDPLAEVRRAVAAGDRSAALAALDAVKGELSGDALEEAVRILEGIAAQDGDVPLVYQLRVDLVARLGDQTRLVDAYLALARHLEGTGSAAKAKTVYQNVLEIDPGNATASAALHEPPAQPAADEGYIDLGELLSDTLSAIAEAPAEKRPEKDDFGKLLDQFRAQASAQVGSDNPAGHYDLGLAFKEMGLIDEAIAEFQTALEGGEEKLKVYEELGQCYMERGQYTVAIGVFDRALQLPHGDPRELIGVCYHLGRCYEALGRRDEARAMYARVSAVDPAFRDVAARLIGL